MRQRLRNLALRDFVRLFPSLQFVQSRKLLTCFILLQTLFCQSIAGGQANVYVGSCQNLKPTILNHCLLDPYIFFSCSF
jgi:hypothetical protein